MFFLSLFIVVVDWIFQKWLQQYFWASNALSERCTPHQVVESLSLLLNLSKPLLLPWWVQKWRCMTLVLGDRRWYGFCMALHFFGTSALGSWCTNVRKLATLKLLCWRDHVERRDHTGKWTEPASAICISPAWLPAVSRSFDDSSPAFSLPSWCWLALRCAAFAEPPRLHIHEPNKRCR